LLDYAIVFALGFLIAGLLSFAMLPVVWSRALRLTRRQLETGIPLSMAEVRAGQDQVRAEAAIELCRLEARIETERDRRHAIMAENGRLTEALRRLKAEAAARVAHIKDAEQGQLGIQADLAEVQQALASVKTELAAARTTLAARDQAIEAMRRELDQGRMEIDGQRVEIVALRTKLGTAEDELAQRRRELESATAAGVERDGRIALHELDLGRQVDSVAALEERALAAERRALDLEAGLAARGADAQALRAAQAELEARLAALDEGMAHKDAALAEARSQLAAAAAEIARLHEAGRGAGEAQRQALFDARIREERARVHDEVEALKREARQSWLAIEEDNRKLRLAMARISAEIAADRFRGHTLPLAPPARNGLDTTTPLALPQPDADEKAQDLTAPVTP
jgi:chromosome segregation ATPase